jgi:hypothetical protein
VAVDLVSWLKDALDEDERTDAPHTDHCSAKSGDGHDFRPDLCDCGWAARVLAEVTAKRAILDLHSPAGITSDPPYKWACSVCHRRDGWWAGEYPCTTVRLLVAPFAARAGFDPSWLD